MPSEMIASRSRWIVEVRVNLPTLILSTRSHEIWSGLFISRWYTRKVLCAHLSRLSTWKNGFRLQHSNNYENKDKAKMRETVTEYFTLNKTSGWQNGVRKCSILHALLYQGQKQDKCLTKTFFRETCRTRIAGSV